VRRDRTADEETTPARRPVLRTVKGAPKPAPKSRRKRSAAKATARTVPRRRRRSTEAAVELARLAGRNARTAQEQLARAADAFAAGRERDAARLLRPLRDAYPDAAAVRELLGLVHYRLGQYPAATKELSAFVDLTSSVEQHPVLMDCWRAQRRYDRVESLWDELALSSPSGALVTEGRIVLAGARADDGRLQDAIATLARRADDVKRVQEHHLRLWYALGDLYERAGEIPRAREMFERVRRRDPSFADVAERLAALA
jgi:tetratricopeptide (TPR) repeat protein